MEIIYSIILATIQGLTEFIPVSSSGHLIILHDLLSFNLTSNIAFDAALHTGTFIAICIYFVQDIIYYIKFQRKFLFIILLASIPAGLAGLFFESYIDQYLRSIWVVIIMLVLVGIIFIITEKYSFQRDRAESLSWQKALLIGFAQILSLIPGTSRSGITIVAGMATKLKREQAARFSFLMGLPLFGAVTLKKGYDLSKIGIGSSEWLIIIVGLLTSMVVGYLCIAYFLKFLKKYPLNVFAYYRFILAFVLMIYLFLNY